MTYAAVNGIPIVKGRISIPGWGIWHADLWTDGDLAIGSAVTIELADLVAVGTVVRDVAWTGQRGVRVVGGAGGWRRAVTAQQYANPQGLTMSTIASDTATTVGESVVVDVDRTVGVQWMRVAGSASDALYALADETWWVGLDGVTHIGTRVPGAIVSVFTATAVDQAGDIVTVATENPADWLPGKTYAGTTVSGTIDRVTHHITAMTMRTEVVNV